jgi:hypothetical protein
VDKSIVQFFLFDSEQASGIIFNCRLPVKMVAFHGEFTFISVFGGIKNLAFAFDIYPI